jgi:hypothetical protein
MRNSSFSEEKEAKRLLFVLRGPGDKRTTSK